jgi:hypothetical protein
MSKTCFKSSDSLLNNTPSSFEQLMFRHPSVRSQVFSSPFSLNRSTYDGEWPAEPSVRNVTNASLFSEEF